jgi:preprotein translocase subunit SecB
MDPEKQPGIQFAQIFLSSAEFRHRADALSLAPTSRPESQQIQIEVRVLQQTDAITQPAALVVKVSSAHDEKALYAFSVEMIAIVEREEGAPPNLAPAEYARLQGPAALYPFIREAVVNLTSRGRFGPVYLKPFNFRAAQAATVAGDAGLEQRPRVEAHATALPPRGKESARAYKSSRHRDKASAAGKPVSGQRQKGKAITRHR